MVGDWAWWNQVLAWSPGGLVLATTPLEIAAIAAGLWSVWASLRESAWCFPSGLLNVALYIAIFLGVGLYAETGLQGVFVVLQLYGWWQWLRGGERGTGVTVARTSLRLWLALAAIAVAAVVPTALALDRWTDSAVPWWDAAPTVLSLVAQWMLSVKKLETWLVWIAVDLISIPLFVSKGLHLTALLYAVYLVLCILGWRAWRAGLRGDACASVAA